MKLWYSFSKELILSSKSWYFYVELTMAIILLFILAFVVPEEFENKSEQYIFLDIPEVVRERYMKNLKEDDLNQDFEMVEVKAESQVFQAILYETEEAKIYILDSFESLMTFSNSESAQTVHVKVSDDNQLIHTYYLQGYETDKLKNLLRIYHNPSARHDVIEAFSEEVEVRQLYKDIKPLNDKENMIPVFLTFNGSLMSLFIIAAYIFLDKNEGIIQAYAITPSSMWHYLLSKIGVIIVTSILTTLIITLPIMGLRPNYFLMIIFLVTSGFFAASLGLFMSSFYKDIIEAFGGMYIVIVIMIMPNISYFTPSWDPDWVKIIPSYVMLQSFKEVISVGANTSYVYVSSFAFLALGVAIFILANYRFKKTLIH